MPNAPAGRRMRVLAGSLDQLFSSTSNGLILFAVAVVSTAQSFGDLAVMMTALFAVIGAQRGALGTPLLLKADQTHDRITREGSFAFTVALAAGVIVGALLVTFGWRIGLPAALLAAITPVALAQDSLRYVAIAHGRAHIAAVWDGLWFAGSIVLLVAAWVTPITLPMLVASWSALAVLSLAGLVGSLRITPRLRGLAGWLREDWQHRLRYGIDAGLEQGTVFTVLAIAAVLLGSVAAAALRGATVLLAPISILASALQLIVISESTRNSSHPTTVWSATLKSTSAIACFTALVGAALCLLPPSLGHFLLGDSFVAAQRVLPVIVIEYASAAVIYSLVIYLKSFNRSSALLRFKVCTTLITVTSATCAALLFGTALGVAVGLATGTVLAGSIGIALFVPWRSHEPPTARPAG